MSIIHHCAGNNLVNEFLCSGILTEKATTEDEANYYFQQVTHS